MLALNRPQLSATAAVLLKKNLPCCGCFDYQEVIIEPDTMMEPRRTAASQFTNDEISFKLFPNPSRGFVNVVYNFPDILFQEFRVEIYDTRGRKIFEKTNLNSRQEIRIELNRYSPGTYTLRLLGDGNELASKKLTLIK